MEYYMYNHTSEETSNEARFTDFGEKDWEDPNGGKELINNDGGYNCRLGHITLLHYCPHCGTETLGRWEYWETGITSSNGRSNLINARYLRGGVDQQELCRLRDRAVSNEKSHCTISAKICEYRHEIEQFTALDKCPMCGAAYEDKKGYHLFFDTASNAWDHYSTSNPLKNMVIGDSCFGIIRRCTPRIDISGETESARVLAQIDNDTITYDGYNLTHGKRLKLLRQLDQEGRNKLLANNRCHAEVRCYDYDSIESMLAFARSGYRQHDGELSQKRLDTFTAMYETTVLPAPPSAVELDTEGLKTFLFHVIQMETSVFSLKERLLKLYYTSIDTDKKATGSRYSAKLKAVEAAKPLRQQYEELKATDPTIGFYLEDVPFETSELPALPKEPVLPQKPNEPMLLTPGFFNRKKIEARNQQLLAAYQTAMQVYSQEYAQYQREYEQYTAAMEARHAKQQELNARREQGYKALCEKKRQEHNQKLEALLEDIRAVENVKTGDADTVTVEMAVHELINNEICQAEALLRDVYTALKKAYSSGVIFGKYQHFVAVSTFYEYLMAGRCDTLSGTNGAYNLYENELRMNTIIGQLTTVIESLEQIKENQFMIYSAIKESNRMLTQLSSSMDSALSTISGQLSNIENNGKDMNSMMARIAENTEVTAYNTAVTAFYSQKTAELTNALGYMAAL